MTKLKLSLQALAQPAEVQLSLFPDFVHKTDELMLDFDDALLLLKCEIWPTLSPCQTEALTRLDEKMTEMTKEPDPDHIPEVALRSDPEWEALRCMAKQALATFEWSDSPPPCEPEDRGTTYVGGK